MSLRTKTLTATLLIGLGGSAFGYTLGDGYQADVLASTITAGDYTQYEGISKHGDTLYMGNFTSVKQYNTKTGTYSSYGDVPGNNNISHATYANGSVYTSYEVPKIGSTPPYPYQMIKTNPDGNSNVLRMGGIFDATVAPDGSFYFVANPDTDNSGVGNGTRLYRMSLTDYALTEVAYLGGASGGITFDDEGNLYYAHYDNDAIYSYSAEQVMAGGLDLADANLALALENGGYLDFDGEGNLVVSHLDDDSIGHTISRYNLETGEKIDDIFTGGRIGGFLADGDTYYILSQTFSWSAYGSELLAVQVPEPATYALIIAALGLGLAVMRRRQTR